MATLSHWYQGWVAAVLVCFEACWNAETRGVQGFGAKSGASAAKRQRAPSLTVPKSIWKPWLSSFERAINCLSDSNSSCIYCGLPLKNQIFGWLRKFPLRVKHLVKQAPAGYSIISALGFHVQKYEHIWWNYYTLKFNHYITHHQSLYQFTQPLILLGLKKI